MTSERVAMAGLHKRSKSVSKSSTMRSKEALTNNSSAAMLSGLCKTFKKRYIIPASMIERARQRMREKQPETSMDVLIDNIYEQETRKKIDCALEYLHDWTKKEPETFDNKYRNIQNFVSSKLKADQKAKDEASVEKVDYFKIQQEYSAMIQALVEKYGIKPEEQE